MDLVKYENDSHTANFLDQVCLFFLVSQTITTTHLKPTSKILCDNIINVDNNGDTVSGNILTTNSCHLQQFILFPIAGLNQMFFR